MVVPAEDDWLLRSAVAVVFPLHHGGFDDGLFAPGARALGSVCGFRQHLSRLAERGPARRRAVRHPPGAMAALAAAGPSRRFAHRAQDPVAPLLPQPVAVRPLPALLHPLGLRGGGLPAADPR